MDQKVVIITGASRGLGEAIARWVSRANAAVTLVARSNRELTETVEKLPSKTAGVLAIAADVADNDACIRVVNQTVARFGRLDTLINNAGVLAPLGFTHQTGPADWQYNLAVNLLGPVQLTRIALIHLRENRGRIINVSSGAAETAIEGAGAYCAAKAALNHFSRVLAAEEPDITTIAVRPGVIDTQMQTTLRNQTPEKMPKKWIEYYYQLKADGKLEPPDIPGRAIAWLALKGPKQLSGRFVSYDDPEIVDPAVSFFNSVHL